MPALLGLMMTTTDCPTFPVLPAGPLPACGFKEWSMVCVDTVCATEVAVVVVAVVEDGVYGAGDVFIAGAGLLVVGVGAPTACAWTCAWA